MRTVRLAFSWLLGLSLCGGAIYFSGCGTTGQGAVQDISASGMIAGSVGLVLADTNPNGTLAWRRAPVRPGRWLERALIPEAFAESGACPSIASASGCNQIDGQTAQLHFVTCSYPGSTATWSGLLQMTDAAGLTCGTVPSSGTYLRQFIGAGVAAASGERTSDAGTQVTIDDATANLGNYQGDTFAPIANAGYGDQVVFSGGVRSQVILNSHVYSPSWNLSLIGTVAIDETAGATQRTASGTVTVYHNSVLMKGTATLTAVQYTDSCCYPVSGSIATAFVATSLSDAQAQVLSGTTETLTFTGCGTAQWHPLNGKDSLVTLDNCI